MILWMPKLTNKISKNLPNIIDDDNDDLTQYDI